jgi:hypothetical protein
MEQEQGKEVERELSLEEIKRHFSQWRSKKNRRKRIPERLWNEAVNLVGRYSVNQVSKALAVDYVKLKTKAAAVGKATLANRSSAPTFVETRLEQVFSPMMANKGGWQLQVERSDGGKLKIQAPNLDEGSLRAVLKGFMGS